MNPVKLRSIVLWLICSLSAGNDLAAQDINESNFTLYTRQQGMSHNIITSLVQDSTGYIWISTIAGLNRFNGSSFIQFHSGNDSLSMPQENLSGLAWLDSRRLAVYTSEGLHIINTRTGETRNVFVPFTDKQYQYKFNGVMAASGNTAGDIFLLTRSGFYHYDKNYQLVFRFDYYASQEVATAHFAFGSNLLWLDQQRLIIVSISGLYLYDINKKEFKKMNGADCPLLNPFLDYPKTNYQFFQPKRGNIFILSVAGDSLYYFNILKNKLTVTAIPADVVKNEFHRSSILAAISDSVLALTGNTSGFFQIKIYPETGDIKFNPKKYFPLYFCRDLLQDRDHTLWIATNKGLLKQDVGQLSIRQVAIPSQLLDTLPNITIDDIYASRDSLYIAARRNGGLLVFDKQLLQFVRQVKFEKQFKTDDNILCFGDAGNNNLLAGTGGPLININLQDGTKRKITLDKAYNPDSWIVDMCKDHDANIWVVTTGDIYKYDTRTKTASLVLTHRDIVDKMQAAISIKDDASGNMWIAGHGLCRYNVKSNSIDRLIDSFPFIRIPDPRINTFTADNQNNLWINSNNNGLICYNIDKGSFRHFTRDNGLPDNNIDAMIVIRDKLWMAGFSGISCLDLHTYKISSFGPEDGFPDQPIPKNSKFFYDSAENKIYIGFTNIVVQFDPGIIFQRSLPPKFFIESIITGDQKKLLFPGKVFKTDWRNNEIAITIGSINLFTSSSQRFAYRVLKDENSPWQQMGTQNTFSISNLSPGNYRIQVKLFSLSNRWPEQITEIGIVITPPFWKQTWFMILMGSLMVLAAYLLLKWRTSFIRRKERAKTHIEKLKTEEYKNRLELEQISNYFTSSLVNKKDIEEVLWDVSRNLIGRMDYEDCMIYLWNEDRTRMVQKASYGPKGNPGAISSRHFDVLPGQGIVGHVMNTREPVLITDTRKDARYRPDDIVRLSELCVPIIHNNELIGIIDSEHHQPGHFKERDVQILTTIATLVGDKIKQIESQQSLEKKQHEISSINQQLAEAQLSALQTQMNPHFIFNSLNSIKSMILANEQKKASRYLSKFAQMIRITLNQSKETFTTLFENVEYLETYMDMEKLRFDDSFNFSITIDEQIDQEETLIPTLMIQPLAENAIWHGLMRKEGQKNLLIHFSKQEEQICCSIEDNGIGIDRSEQLKKLTRPTHQSVGLNNLRNRIKIMNEKFGTGCTLQITDLSDPVKEKTGTCAVLCFNIITIKP